MEPAGTGSKALAWMQKNDQHMISLLCDLKVEKVLGEATTYRNACGPGALTALLSVLKMKGIERGILVEYTTSHGLQPEEHFRTGVGYAGIVY
jgi:AmmeMemoRadiSam system protein B